MQISQLYHLISEVERESRQRANDKYRGELRRIENKKNKLGMQILDLMSCCVSPLDSVELHLVDKSRILDIVSEKAELEKRQASICNQIADEAERVAQMLLNKKGVRIVVEERQSVDPYPYDNLNGVDYSEETKRLIREMEFAQYRPENQ